MKIVVAIKQVPSRDSQLKVNAVRHLDRRRRSRLGDQRAGCLRARSGAAAQREAERRSGGALRRARARRADHSRSLAKGADRAIHIETEKTGLPIRWRSRA